MNLVTVTFLVTKSQRVKGWCIFYSTLCYTTLFSTFLTTKRPMLRTIRPRNDLLPFRSYLHTDADIISLIIYESQATNGHQAPPRFTTLPAMTAVLKRSYGGKITSFQTSPSISLYYGKKSNSYPPVDFRLPFATAEIAP